MASVELIDEMNGGASCPPEFLYDRLKSGKWCIYIGSGVSTPACGSWSKLITELCDACGVTYSQLDLTSSEKLLELADCALAKDITAYQHYLYQKLGPPLQKTSNGYEQIVGLPYCSCITTNFDDGLAFVYRVSGGRKPVGVYPYLDPTDIHGRIFYLHGKIQTNPFNTNHIVLGNRTMTKAYQDGEPLADFLEVVLKHNNLLVVGASLSEKPLQQLLHRVNDLIIKQETEYKTPVFEKFILLPKDKQDQVGSFTRLGFKVFTYTNEGLSNHSVLYEYLETVGKLHKGATAKFNQML